jgi:hypothetical protein
MTDPQSSEDPIPAADFPATRPASAGSASAGSASAGSASAGSPGAGSASAGSLGAGSPGAGSASAEFLSAGSASAGTRGARGRASRPASGRAGRPRPVSDTPAGDRSADDLLAPRPPAVPVRVGLASPASVLAIVPSLLGFHPSQSLVVLGVSGPRNRVSLTFRYDLPDPPDDELAADIAAHACEVLTREAIPAAVLIGYGRADPVAEAARPVIATLLDAGVDVIEVLRAEGGRCFTVNCQNPDCCPPEGVPFDPCSHPAAAALKEAGIDVLPDRAALARTLQPPPGTVRATRQATNRALRRLDRLVAVAREGGLDPAAALADAGRAAVRDAIRRYRTGSSIEDRARLAFLAVVLADLRVRDDAWAQMDPGRAGPHTALWTDIVTGAAPEFVPAPASLLAFTAWQAGEGALANVAAERALAADPAYSMALLIGGAVQAGMPPSAARLPMTQDEVAASYE